MNLQFLLNKVSNRVKNEFKLLDKKYEIIEHREDSYISAVNAIKIIRQELQDDSIIFGGVLFNCSSVNY